MAYNPDEPRDERGRWTGGGGGAGTHAAKTSRPPIAAMALDGETRYFAEDREFRRIGGDARWRNHNPFDLRRSDLLSTSTAASVVGETGEGRLIFRDFDAADRAFFEKAHNLHGWSDARSLAEASKDLAPHEKAQVKSRLDLALGASSGKAIEDLSGTEMHALALAWKDGVDLEPGRTVVTPHPEPGPWRDFTASAGASPATVRSAPDASAGVQTSPTAISGLSLNRDQYLEAVSHGLWRRLEGETSGPKTGFSNDAQVGAVTRANAKIPDGWTNDVAASPDLAAMVVAIARPTASARLSGGRQEFEKLVVLGRNAQDEVVVTDVAILGAQGGAITPYLRPDSVAALHVHYPILVQPPNASDDSALKLKNLPSFVFAGETDEVFEIGRVKGRICIRSVGAGTRRGPWEEFKISGEYRRYDGGSH